MKARLSIALLLVAVLALALAVWGLRPPRLEHRLNAILVFDITQSMNVEDMKVDHKPVSRLEWARQSARATLNALPCGSTLGYGLFTEYRTVVLFAPIEVCQHRRELDDGLDLISGKMAWSGNSEVAKAYYAGLRLMPRMSPMPAMVLLTDGHEAPPVNPKLRPRFDGVSGDVPALIVGVGGDVAAPIPKFDPLGNSLGLWRIDEVSQIDPFSKGRGGSVSAETMSDDDTGGVANPRVTTSPGREHFSSLRGDYLRLLSEETGARYVRGGDVNALPAALTQAGLTQPISVRANWDWVAAAAALLALVAYYALGWRQGS